MIFRFQKLRELWCWKFGHRTYTHPRFDGRRVMIIERCLRCRLELSSEPMFDGVDT